MSVREIKQGPAHTMADCGVFAALSLVLVLISTYVPLIGMVASLVWAVPIIVVVLRRGAGAGAAASVVVLILAILFTGPVAGFVAGVSIGIFGVTYGYCFKRSMVPGKTLFIGTVAAGIVAVITLAFSVFLTSLPLSSMIDSMEEAFRSVFRQYDEMGLLTQILPAGTTAEEYIDSMVAMFQRLLPGVIVLSAMAMAALNYIFAYIILKKAGFVISPLAPFRDWHLPWWIMWGMVPVLLCYLMGKQLDGQYYFAIAQNILYIYLPLFLISGISIMSYLFRFWHLSTGAQAVIWVLCGLFMSFALPFVVIIGAVDVIVDYRNILQGLQKKSQK
ncbi:MAG: YybS family protein [Bacillota bacterium]|nr:YybS family protein [Bacillota bacterium]